MKTILLPEQEILTKIKEYSYQEVADQYNVSRGKIWNIVTQNNALKYKTLRDYKGVLTGLWACPRPMGKYKGKYPKGYLNRLANLIDFDGMTILHLFSGSIEGNYNHITLDINPAVKPDLIADARQHIPLEDESVGLVDADPPYDSDFKIYGKRLYGTNEVKPYSFIKESVRVLEPNGYLCILHQLVYKTPKGCKRKGVIGITTGPNMRIRVLNIFQKQ